MIKSFLVFLYNPRLLRYLLTVYLSLWILIFTSAFMTKACVNKKGINKKLAYCNVALFTSIPIQPLTNIEVKLYFEKGLALSSMGQAGLAMNAFHVAIEESLNDNFGSLDEIEIKENISYSYLIDRISSENKKSNAYINFMDALAKYEKSLSAH